MKPLKLSGDNLTLENIEEVARCFRIVELTDKAKENVKRARKFVEKKAQESKSYYGINTGFGALCNIKIPKDELEQLQENIIVSHAAGVGEKFPEEVVRAAILIRINSLVQGNSGIRMETLDMLLTFLNKRVCPCVPQQGSVGSSGDLAPLAHIMLPMLGLSEVIFKGKTRKAIDVLKGLRLKPLKLSYKEGLALVNGTAVMCASAVLSVLDGERLLKMADISGTMSLEALRGTEICAKEELHKLRPHPGQIAVAANIRRLMKGSKIKELHKDCGRVQDAYSLRCMPQVHGASRDAVNYVRRVLEIEVNSVTDNPLLFPETDEVVSGGNFHGQPVALAMDFFGIAIAELANISERRISRLVTSQHSGLPPFLIENSGTNSGFMIPQYTAASLVSENKVLAHPASVDSIPTCAGQEDHVSMGTIAARKAGSILKNVWNVIAIELLAAAQGLDFLLPALPGPALQNVWKVIRGQVPKLVKDRCLYLDIEKMSSLMKEGAIISAVEKNVNLE